MTTPSRPLARAARMLADQQSARIAQATSTLGGFWATVTSINPGAGAGGSAQALITYRGEEFPARYAKSYTPVLGDRVLVVTVQDQPAIVAAFTG